MTNITDNWYKPKTKNKNCFSYHILHLIKTPEKPFYYLLSGGAWMGKSHFIKSLYQAVLKYNSSTHWKSSQLLASKVLRYIVPYLPAKPASQSTKNFKTLASSGLNSIRCKLHAVKLIFLNEASMVGNSMFNVQINQRY